MTFTKNQDYKSYQIDSINTNPNFNFILTKRGNRSNFRALPTSLDYIDVYGGCWRRNVLVTTIRCW